MKTRRSSSIGTIYQLPSGHWRAQVSIQGRRVSKTKRTKQEARAWITQVTSQATDGINYNAAQQRLAPFLERWLETKSTHIRPTTLQNYQIHARNYIIPALGKIKLCDLTPGLVQSLIDQMVAAGQGSRTIRITYTVLHGCMQHALRLGLVTRNIVSLTLPPKVQRRQLHIWDETQVSAFLASIAGEHNEHLYHLALSTGMRQGELLGLRWADIDWTAARLSVVQQALTRRSGVPMFSEPKSDRGRRTILLGAGAIRHLRQQQIYVDGQRRAFAKRWHEHDLVFPSTAGTPQNKSNLLRQFRAYVQRANLPPIRFHDLRHTAASLMLDHNIPPIVVAGILGQSLAVLMDTYAHHIPQSQTAAAQLMDEITTPYSLPLEVHNDQ